MVTGTIGSARGRGARCSASTPRRQESPVAVSATTTPIAVERRSRRPASRDRPVRERRRRRPTRLRGVTCARHPDRRRARSALMTRLSTDRGSSGDAVRRAADVGPGGHRRRRRRHRDGASWSSTIVDAEPAAITIAGGLPDADEIVTVLADPPITVAFADVADGRRRRGHSRARRQTATWSACAPTSGDASTTSSTSPVRSSSCRQQRAVDDQRRRRPTSPSSPTRRRRHHRRPMTTPATAPTTTTADHAAERDLLTSLGRDHRPPLRLGALDVGLLVGDRRAPSPRPRSLSLATIHGWRVYERRPGGIGPRWNRQRSEPITSATGRASATGGGAPSAHAPDRRGCCRRAPRCTRRRGRARRRARPPTRCRRGGRTGPPDRPRRSAARARP